MSCHEPPRSESADAESLGVESADPSSRHGARWLMATGGLLGALDLPGTEASVPRGRAWLRGRLGSDHPALDDALLLASELMTNAVRHSDSRRGGTVTLVAAALPGVVHIVVIDDGSALAPRVGGDGDGEGGRGLFLVDQLARSWGIYDDSAGRAVWFEIKF